MEKQINVDDITNSIMAVMDKELRKHDLAPAFHAQYHGNREIIKGMVAIMAHSQPETDTCSK